MTHSSGILSPLSLSSALLALGTTFVACAAFVDEYKSGINWPEPKVIDPGPAGGPPSDAIVLFDGKDLSQKLARAAKNGKLRSLVTPSLVKRELTPKRFSATASCTLNGRLLRKSAAKGRGAETAASI